MDSRVLLSLFAAAVIVWILVAHQAAMFL